MLLAHEKSAGACARDPMARAASGLTRPPPKGWEGPCLKDRDNNGRSSCFPVSPSHALERCSEPSRPSTCTEQHSLGAGAWPTWPASLAESRAAAGIPPSIPHLIPLSPSMPIARLHAADGYPSHGPRWALHHGCWLIWAALFGWVGHRCHAGGAS